MRYRVLGSIEVADGGRPIAIGRGKPRLLLAALLIDANRGVSVDELIERLWAGEPPLTATKSVQVLVSQLRRALGREEASIATVGSGYMLRIKPGDMDIDRFEELLERGRGQLGEGRPRDAEATLDEALALWRGRAYEDVAYEDFAREEIARLEERRLVAMEERFEAMLAGGRHIDAVAGLERLVAEHPLRERVLRLLMLALYRTGRRADALAVYDAARRRLSEQLGIEPGEPLRRLHAAILEGAGTGEEAAARIDLEAPASRPRFPPRLIAAAGAALLAAAVAVGVATHGEGSARVVRLHGDSVGLVQPGSGHVVGQFAVGVAPSQVVADAHVAWTVNADARTVSRIDLATGRVRTLGTVATPTALALGGGSLWVSYANPLQEYGMFSVGILRLDPTSLQQSAQIPLARQPRGGPLPLLVTPRGVWVGTFGSADRIDPARDRADLRVPVSDPQFGASTLLALAQLRGAIWALTDDRSVVQIDPASRKVRVLTKLDIPAFGTMVAGSGSLWVSELGRVWRLDPTRRQQPHDIITGVNASDIAFGDGAVWVTNEVTGALTRIDPATEHVRSMQVGGAPTAVSVSAAGVLVAAASGSGGINADSCGRVISAPGVRPRLVIAADLDLYDAGYTPPMARAIRDEFRRHNFTAGRYRVGLQICNDSTLQSVIADSSLCVANARVYAKVKRVIGVIGPVQSACAFDEGPVLDRHGPVAMVGVGNNPGLTLSKPGSSVYPAGVRNFARVSSRYDQWGTAAALLARRLGLHRVYLRVGDPRDFYGSYMAPAFAREARRLDIQVIGPASPARGFQRLGRRLKAQGVDGVFDADVNGDPGFVAAMRTALGPSATLIGPDTFLPLFGTSRVPRAERGMYVIGADFTHPARQLPNTGRAVVAAVARKQPSNWTDAWVPYAAQATDVLMSAIAASNGTRESVTRQLFHVRVTNGPLGSFAITATGDPSRSIVLAYRVVAKPPWTRPVAVFRVPASAN